MNSSRTDEQLNWISDWKIKNPKTYFRKRKFLTSWSDLCGYSHNSTFDFMAEATESLKLLMEKEVYPFIDNEAGFTIEDDYEERWGDVAQQGIFVSAKWIETDEEHHQRGKIAWEEMYKNDAEFRQNFHMRHTERDREERIDRLQREIEKLKSERNPLG